MDDIELRVRLERIERLLLDLAAQGVVRDWYTCDEFAAAVGMAPFTVREHCRLGRLNACKRSSGRGAHCSWVLSHEELERYRRQGLLPLRLEELRRKG